jgi:dipeptidyl aminopeptidase/acylaminoacyl peptidase
MLGLRSEAAPQIVVSGPQAQFLRPSYAVDAASSGRLAAVVAFYPPVDLRPLAGPNERFPALDFDPDAAGDVSPILFASEDDPPTLLVHGNADELVPVANSERLQTALAATGVIHELLIIEAGDHGFTNAEHRSAATGAMVAWFKRHLAP